ncbi:MAG: CCA tRNA nucleotidyltransferase [Clostridium sp.]|nr:CCA tRNA nucleotidyltransferase [Clostridium sp.]
MNSPIVLPPSVTYIIQTLQLAGYEAYVVGGCVRDSLLGREPKDWDVTTQATPPIVKELFRRTVDTGIKHGTVTVLKGDESFEVTTYRIDGTYMDARHPSEVTFTPSLHEDLKRRDFTINAMAYEESAGLIDPFNGSADLEQRILRCVGNPLERFQEDALRMLRAIRFCAQLNFEMEPRTKEAILSLAPLIQKISQERLRDEIQKILLSPHPEFIGQLYELGLSAYIFPEWDAVMETPQIHPHHRFGVGEHILEALRVSPPNKNVRLALLLHDIGKPQCLTTSAEGRTHFYGHDVLSAKMTRRILNRFRYDHATIDWVSSLVEFHDYGKDNPPTMYMMRRLMQRIGVALCPDLFEVMRADILAQSDYKRSEKLEALDEMISYFHEIQARGDCVKVADLAINGKDLLSIGFKPGPQIGVILHKLMEFVLETPSMNTKESLLTYVLDTLSDDTLSP